MNEAAHQIRLLPVSVVIPTKERQDSLQQTLAKLVNQSSLPQEIIIVDGSAPEELDRLRTWIASECVGFDGQIAVLAAEKMGAAPQRNQGFAQSTCASVLFMDDDILMEPDSLERLWLALESDSRLAGVSAMLVNEHYDPPGPISSRLFAWLNGGPLPSYAGRCLGPGLTTYPANDDTLPEVVTVDWLITGCVLYRRQILPAPPFHGYFTGASFGEDLALSLTVGRTHRLANARTARAFHMRQHSIPSAARTMALAEMELLNRHFIMTDILKRTSMQDYLQFFLINFVLFAATLLQHGGSERFLPQLRGRLVALWQICLH